MPDGGTLTIETQNQTIDEADRAHGPTSRPPGDYVVVRVTDTGVGMTPEVQARIFEPFFTTKERGHGTGLGLAAVYGIVKQLGGNIYVDSEPGRGTVFKIYLPKTDQPAVTRPPPAPVGGPVGNETILVVEDEPGVRRFARTILTRHGYRVVEAESSEAALAGLAGEPRQLDLLLTDVMLSGRNGGELATDLRRMRPELPVLFMSGFADSTVRAGLPDGCTVLEKPFTAHTLLWLVGDALGRR